MMHAHVGDLLKSNIKLRLMRLKQHHSSTVPPKPQCQNNREEDNSCYNPCQFGLPLCLVQKQWASLLLCISIQLVCVYMRENWRRALQNSTDLLCPQSYESISVCVCAYVNAPFSTLSTNCLWHAIPYRAYSSIHSKLYNHKTKLVHPVQHKQIFIHRLIFVRLLLWLFHYIHYKRLLSHQQ